MGQFLLGDAGHSLEVIVASVAEVGGAKAEENSHRAAVPTFILQEVCAVLGAHLPMEWERYQYGKMFMNKNGFKKQFITHTFSQMH